jgi:hypothetical protein
VLLVCLELQAGQVGHMHHMRVVYGCHVYAAHTAVGDCIRRDGVTDPLMDPKRVERAPSPPPHLASVAAALGLLPSNRSQNTTTQRVPSLASNMSAISGQLLNRTVMLSAERVLPLTPCLPGRVTSNSTTAQGRGGCISKKPSISGEVPSLRQLVRPQSSALLFKICNYSKSIVRVLASSCSHGECAAWLMRLSG